MARPRALTNVQIFEIADSLRGEGVDPTVTRVSARAKEIFSATPSYSTLKQGLNEWRSLGSTHRASGVSAEFLELVLRAFRPLYHQLVDQVRSEQAPELAAARESESNAAEELLKCEADRHRQSEEIHYLRNLSEKSGERERDLAQQLATARGESERANTLCEAARAQLETHTRMWEAERAQQLQQLNSARERVTVLEQQLSGLLSRRTELDQRYETLIEHFGKQAAKQEGPP